MKGTARLALALATAFAAVSCGGGGSATAPTTTTTTTTTTTAPSTPQATVTITITGQGGTQAFSPNPATITPGQVVVFKNTDSVVHHVMLDDGSAQTTDINPGTTSAPMAIGVNATSYHCIIHPGMVGGFNGVVGDPPPNCSQAYC
jgi:plastocyanin